MNTAEFLRFVALLSLVLSYSVAISKKKQHVVFVSVSTFTSGQYLANAAQELRHRDDTVDVTMITYRNQLSTMSKYLYGNETSYFQAVDIPISVEKRMFLNMEFGNHSTNYFAKQLVTYFENYDNEIKELEILFKEHVPDLLVVDMFAVSAMDLAASFKIPYIVLFHTPNWLELSGLPSDKNNLTETLKNLWDTPSRSSIIDETADLLYAKRSSYFPLVKRDIESLYRNHLVLVPSVFGFEYARSLHPLVRMVGLYNNNNDPYAKKPSNGHEKVLLSWLGVNEQPVVYFQVSSDVLPSKEQLMAVIEGALSTHHRVLIAVRHQALSHIGLEYNDLIKGDEDHVNVLPFAPNVMVLAHKTVKVFVTHGGMQGVSEAIYAKVPLIVLPVTASHVNAAERVTDAKIGFQLNPLAVTADNITTLLEELQVDKTRRRIVRRMTQLQQINDVTTGSFVNGTVKVIQEMLLVGDDHLIVQSSSEVSQYLTDGVVRRLLVECISMLKLVVLSYTFNLLLSVL